MKKFALVFVAAFCFPVVGLTGCGGSGGENSVIEVVADEAPIPGADEEQMNAEMEAAMAQPEGADADTGAAE